MSSKISSSPSISFLQSTSTRQPEAKQISIASDMHSQPQAPEAAETIKNEFQTILIARHQATHKDVKKLIQKGNFDDIPEYLENYPYADWARSLFKSVCLDKAQIILEFYSSYPLQSLVTAWNLYYQRPNSIFKNTELFDPEQENALHTLLKKKILPFLLLYLAIEMEKRHVPYKKRVESIFPFLSLLSKGQAVPIPLKISTEWGYHYICLLIEPKPSIDLTSSTSSSSSSSSSSSCPPEIETVTLTLYNSGMVLYTTGDALQYHAASPDGTKNQTYVRKSGVPYEQLFDVKTWKQILRKGDDNSSSSIYSLIFEQLGRGGVLEKSSHPCDYESPQHSPTCLVQHIMAAIRDQFMQCEALGDKEMRYAAYRVVISDFNLFLGKEAPKELLDQLCYKNRQIKAPEMLFIWEQRERKLQAILQLAQSIRREDVPNGNGLRYFYEQNALAQRSSPSDVLAPATASLAEAYQAYSQHRRQQQIFLLKTLRHLKADIVRAPFDEQFPLDALYCLKYAKTEEEKEEIKQVILEELKDDVNVTTTLRNLLTTHGLPDFLPMH